MIKFKLIFFLPFLFVLLLACGPGPDESFVGTDITGIKVPQKFGLINQKNEEQELSDFPDKITLLFFGFTSCPDVCPSSLAKFAMVRDKLGPDRKKFQVIFVTLDPEVDTSEVLAEYVGAFDESFIGLTGTSEQISHIANAFKIFYEKNYTSDTRYTIDHFAGYYLLDNKGQPRVLLKSRHTVEEISSDVTKLISLSQR